MTYLFLYTLFHLQLRFTGCDNPVAVSRAFYGERA